MMSVKQERRAKVVPYGNLWSPPTLLRNRHDFNGLIFVYHKYAYTQSVKTGHCRERVSCTEGARSDDRNSVALVQCLLGVSLFCRSCKLKNSELSPARWPNADQGLLAAAKTGVRDWRLNVSSDTWSEVTMTLNKRLSDQFARTQHRTYGRRQPTNHRFTYNRGAYARPDRRRRGDGTPAVSRVCAYAFYRFPEREKDQTLSPLRRPLLTRRIVRTKIPIVAGVERVKKKSRPNRTSLRIPDSHLTIAEDPKRVTGVHGQPAFVQPLARNWIQDSGVPKQQKIKRLRSPLAAHFPPAAPPPRPAQTESITGRAEQMIIVAHKDSPRTREFGRTNNLTAPLPACCTRHRQLTAQLADAAARLLSQIRVIYRLNDG
ncbi:hypothetical protein EVAR_100194_1 [Eumeta japonica]|uniref:Uncharacterized protein n=1 Tax=Eumeta variegata TaxID=151549 RepID=A0A4C2AAY2_EUMVA|nr:hypothetical protein EVAR_100194_1 [Eumeta japonica]